MFVPFLALLLHTSCKKQEVIPVNIYVKDTNIYFNDDSTRVNVLKEQTVLFKSNTVFRSYFMAAGVYITPQRKLMVVATRGKNDDDFGAMDLVGKELNLESNAVSTESMFIQNGAKLNTGSPSFLYVGKKLHAYYVKRESYTDADIYVRESKDNGATWGMERKVNTLDGHNLMMNDRVIRTSTGRIIVPVALTSDIHSRYAEQKVICYMSDDEGKNWSASEQYSAGFPLMEPSIAEISKNNLIMVIRNTFGKLMFARSKDNGKTWSHLVKSKINSITSSSAVYSIGKGRLALIWNNNTPGRHVFDRTPLSLSISKDGGVTWSIPYTIANTPGEIYTSPAMMKYKEELILLYNRSKNAADYDICYKRISIK